MQFVLEELDYLRLRLAFTDPENIFGDWTMKFPNLSNLFDIDGIRQSAEFFMPKFRRYVTKA